ncbi:MAG TPA: hypothetical protein VGP08_02895 [Pyrinomonadaceae bacterium]|jgi:hypothetical protein|nr:hypothetical protein [Pyrinomonadaceae bacterium]
MSIHLTFAAIEAGGVFGRGARGATRLQQREGKSKKARGENSTASGGGRVSSFFGRVVIGTHTRSPPLAVLFARARQSGLHHSTMKVALFFVLTFAFLLSPYS